MGVASKMNYAGMDAIVTLVENRMTIIGEYLDTLSSDVVSKIATAYSGEAATAYKETLAAVSEQMNTDLNDLITSLKTAINETQTNYENQDRKMEDSVADAKRVVSSNN